LGRPTTRQGAGGCESAAEEKGVRIRAEDWAGAAVGASVGAEF
jgi:hypothetical protein